MDCFLTSSHVLYGLPNCHDSRYHCPVQGNTVLPRIGHSVGMAKTMWDWKLNRSVLLIGAVFCYLSSLLLHFVNVEMSPVGAAMFGAGLVLLCLGVAGQAPAIEQTPSSLEEMSGTVGQNAGNVPKAERLMHQVAGINSREKNSTNRLMEFMQEISSAGDKTQKILKTIDEIAVQTNLLALEAAVEAVRVGEAGAGFAAVADEVKNLALRATEAAKNIADLIESTDKRVEEGSELLEKTDKEFREVTVSVGRSSELIGRIDASSLEQVQGTEQVNTAMSEMDKVVQQNASNAGESASASEEMNAQVYQMQGFVEARKCLADGSRDNGTTGSNKVTGKKRSAGIPVKIAVLEKKIVGRAPRGKRLGEGDRSS